MPSQHRFEINYLFNSEPRAQVVERDRERFPQAEVARYLIALHHADAESGLLMPGAEADEARVLEQAEVLGISDIRVSQLNRVRTPGHYRQP